MRAAAWDTAVVLAGAVDAIGAVVAMGELIEAITGRAVVTSVTTGVCPLDRDPGERGSSVQLGP